MSRSQDSKAAAVKETASQAEFIAKSCEVHFPANAAWLACTAICHNLTRAAGTLAGPPHAKARGMTIRSQLISVAARIARHGRGHITLHLPEGWHRQAGWMNLFEAACGPPAAAA